MTTMSDHLLKIGRREEYVKMKLPKICRGGAQKLDNFIANNCHIPIVTIITTMFHFNKVICTMYKKLSFHLRLEELSRSN